MQRKVLIYRNELLARSETFILGQATSLKRYAPVFAGLERVPGLVVPDPSLILTSGGLPGRAQRAVVRMLGVTTRMAARVATHRPALIHAHFGMDGTVAASLARRLNTPLVVTFHGYDATTSDEVLRRSGLRDKLYLRKRASLFARAQLLLCVSEYIREQIVARGAPLDRTRVHYTGIDTNFFTPSPTVAREPIVLFVGRLVEKKGCEYLIRAMAEVAREHPTAELVVIGDGPLRPRLENLARTLPRTRFLGPQPAQVVRDWMNRAMVFCVPSIIADSGDAEGFGMVFAEAQAMGVPVVSFASGGIPEAVLHEATGLLAPERDTTALARNLSLLLNRTPLWDRLSAAGSERVRRLFDLDRQTRHLESIYDAVLSTQG